MTRITPHTRLHRLIELTDAGDLPTTDRHYVIGSDLMAAMPRVDIAKSVQAMISVGMNRLPFPSLLMEFSVQPEVWRFAWLKETGAGVEVTSAFMTAKGLAAVAVQPSLVSIQNGALSVSGHADENDGHASLLAVALSMLMLNIQGVDRVLIEPTRLNASRQKAGKGRIPTCTLLRIGSVYNREGKAVPGIGMKAVYLRAGHVRQQAYGPGWTQHRSIYVAPQLVNYQSGDVLPTPVPRLIRM